MKKTLLSLSLLISTISMAQNNVTLNPDKDNSIFSNNTSNSAGQGYLYVGQTCQANNRRAFLHFDIAGSGIPAGATIVSVSLDLNANKDGSQAGAQTFSLHPVNIDWGEGTSLPGGAGGQGAAGVSPDVTWNAAELGITAWTTPGGDYGAASASTTLSGSLTTFTWSSPGMIADVQDWLDNPGNNNGWVLIGDEAAVCTARRFGSSELGTAPVLNIGWCNPPTAVCQNVTVNLNANGLGILDPDDLDNGSTSPCGSNLTFDASVTSFTCDDIGTSTVTLTVTDDFGLTNTCPAQVTVDGSGVDFDTTTTVTGSTIQANQTGASYQWVECPGYSPLAGETLIVFNASTDGDYACVITMNGCIDTTSCVTLSNVGLDENGEASFNAIPNPANDFINLQLPVGHGEIVIYNLNGQVVLRQNINNTNETLNISQFESGVYIIEVKSDDLIMKQRVAVQK